MRRLTLSLLALALVSCHRRTAELSEKFSSPVELMLGGRTTTTGASAGGHFSVDCRAKGHRISPLIYGIGLDPKATRETIRIGASARRWGGNTTSRFNWELGDAWNTGSDWFFENVEAPRFTSFLDDDDALHLRTALTVPMLGWVAKDKTTAAFPITVFGHQQRVDEGRPEAGNGRTPGGRPLTPGSPERTSTPSSPESVGRWIESLRKLSESRGAREVDLVILDNEPTLWSETHRDVHPYPVGYDELAERSIAYAAAVRKADPGVRIAGPAEWGWTGYFYSAVDKSAGVFARPDRRAHGDVPLVPWYLQRMRAESERRGVRLLDVLDLHFYPQGERVYSKDDDPATAALRIRQTRALWDKSYVDESWIKEPVALLPRMREWADQAWPGTDIMVGEWSFGGEGRMSGGLATAEALGRFADAGVYAAFYWMHPPPDSPTAAAFRAYRDFDGHGAAFGEFSLPATGVANASLFASRDDSGKRLVMVSLNFSPSAPLDTAIDLNGAPPVQQVRAWSYTGKERSFVSGRAETTAGGVQVHLEPYSINVIEAVLGAPLSATLDPHP